MQSEPVETPAQAAVVTRSVRSLRMWPLVARVALFWLFGFVTDQLEMPYFVRFLSRMAAPALVALLFFIWWWASRRIGFVEKLFGFAVVIGTGAAAMPFWHESVGGWFGLFLNLPIVLTAWTLWLLAVKKLPVSWYRPGLVVVMVLSWGYFGLVRLDGLNSDLQADVRWRWRPSEEDLFLAEIQHRADNLNDSQSPSPENNGSSVNPGDWPAFRGPERDGVIRAVTIATDWSANPPRLLWRHRVGPAWSSVIVIGDRLFTQEQRGEKETVVCYNASTGNQLWVHEDSARFWESVSGPGPRATPTFADGRIFALGGTGLLNCLDAGTGKRYWSCDIKVDTGAKVPMWGFSGSPLVVEGKVIVFAGGEGQKNLLAYRAEGGELVWTATVASGSYSSPQLATIAGKPQILFLSDRGLVGIEPGTGAVLWEHGLAMPGAPRTVQPHVINETQLVVGTLAGPGVSLIDVTQDSGAWKVLDRWASTELKPEFPDFVVHQGHAYGFDVSIFCCIDLSAGKRRWKAGRYGRGQVMLLADQSLLLVISETGQAILVAANPDRHEELGRFQAINGKTWNHPVIAHGRLYLRNAEELACYELR